MRESGRASLAGIWRRHPIACATAPILLVIGIQILVRRNSEWDDVFVRAARELLQGVDIYRPGRAYLYPPFAAFAAIPFAVVPRLVSQALWALINVWAAIVAVRSAWQISGGGHVGALGKQNQREWLAIILAAVATLPFGLNAI